MKGKQSFQSHFAGTLGEQKSRITVIICSLFVLGAANSLFLLCLGPFLKSLFQLESPDSAITLGSLLTPYQEGLFPAFAQISVQKSILAIAVPVALSLTVIVKNMALFYYQWNMSCLSHYIAKRLRDRLFCLVVEQPYSLLSKKSPAQWMSYLVNDVLYLQNNCSEILNGFVKESILILSAIIPLFIISPSISVVILILGAVGLFLLFKNTKKISTYIHNSQTELSSIAEHVLNIRKRYDFIKCQEGSGKEQSFFRKVSLDYYKVMRQSLVIRKIFAPFVEWLGFCLFSIILFLLTKGSLPLEFSAFNILIFFAALGMTLRPLRGLTEQLTKYQETKGSLQKCLEIMDQMLSPSSPVDVKEKSQQSYDSKNDSASIIQSISCGLEEETLLEGHQLDLSQGQTVAVIGASGSGKSTLLKTLAGLHPPLKWQSSVSWQSVGDNSVMLGQKPYLFSDTIHANLTYGLPHIQDSDIWTFLEMVFLKKDISQLDQSLQTSLGGLSSKVSGGQLQRLVLARTLLQKRRLILLDEATSAIDHVMEHRIVESLIDYTKKFQKTLVMATHRFNILKAVDQVWYIDDGKIQLQGKHDILMNHERYREFCSANSG